LSVLHKNSFWDYDYGWVVFHYPAFFLELHSAFPYLYPEKNPVSVYKYFFKPLFFLLSPERAHHLVTALLKAVLSLPIIGVLFRRLHRFDDQRLRRQVFGLDFPNPVGLAAGFDKDGRHLDAMAGLGFGFIEVGTVTPRPQPGNPIPRLFRLPSDEALINRMGFNNEGVEALVKRLKKDKPEGLIVGGNIGKNKDTPIDRADEDYVLCFEALFPYVDYFVVNVSSPNTPGLRTLQEKEPLTRLLNRIQEINQKQQTPKPLLLKIAPDLTDGQLDDILDIAFSIRLDGIVATNTTISREGLRSNPARIRSIGDGGLSGKPLRQRSTEIIRYLSDRSNGKLIIIGVGGIAGPEDAIEKIEAGATLVQLYTGLIFEGPTLVRRINKALIMRISSHASGAISRS
jgi:dihydroorotate dehydrogenase